MIAVIFELEPMLDRENDYLEIASHLKSLVENIDGFISMERFRSLTHPRKLLSLSFWRDEQAVHEWRNTLEHRQAQAAGRDHIFRDYRLRIAAVVRDYGMRERDEAPADSQAALSEPTR